MNTAKEVIEIMEAMADERQRDNLMRFFKTGKGEYGEGDQFLGIKVPQTRAVVKRAKGLPLDEAATLLCSQWHEVRLCGFLILVDRFEALAKKRIVDTDAAIDGRDRIVCLYLVNAHRANNWDLVDLSAPKIIGHWLMLPSRLGDMNYKLSILDNLSDSDNLWLQRISIVSTWKTSQMGDASFCLRQAERHLHHPHDLMHKAVGWMLREMGKRVSTDLLRDFLDRHAHEMPRTALRYALEHFNADERRHYMEM